MQQIELKTWNPDYQEIKNGEKKFDVRLADKNFKKGDQIIFREYYPEIELYSGDYYIKTIKIIKYLKINSAVKFGEKELEYWTEEQIKEHGLVILGF